MPGVAKYVMMAISGTGPLWFVQVLWLLCLVLLLVRALDRRDRCRTWCGKAGIVPVILLGVLFWAGEQTLIRNPRPESADGLLNLYKPLFYLVPFLLGYFVFSHDEVQEKVEKAWIPLMACAVVSGGILIGTTFGQDNTSPDVPRDDGLVQGPVRPYGALRRLYDPLQLRHLYRPLPGHRQPGLHDEDVHPAASVGPVCHPWHRCLYAVSVAV